MRAGCTKNTHPQKSRSLWWLEQDFVHNLRPQAPRSQKREEKFDSYCLFHVALDATLFKMFHVQAAHAVTLQCCLMVGWAVRVCLALFKGEGRVRDHFNPVEALTLNPSP